MNCKNGLALSTVRILDAPTWDTVDTVHPVETQMHRWHVLVGCCGPRVHAYAFNDPENKMSTCTAV